MFHIYLIMKVGNFIYYNIKELVAIRLISIRNWNYLHTLDDNFLFGFCKNRTLNHKFPTECWRWQNMCTEHGLTRSGLEPTIYRTRGEHANDYIYCRGADPGFQVRGGGGGALKQNCAERREARKMLGYFGWLITILRQKNHISFQF